MRKLDSCSLWLGNVADVRDLSSVLSVGVLAIIDLAASELPLAPPRDIVYCRFPLVDGPGNPPWIMRNAVATTAAFIQVHTATFRLLLSGHEPFAGRRRHGQLQYHVVVGVGPRTRRRSWCGKALPFVPAHERIASTTSAPSQARYSMIDKINSGTFFFGGRGGGMSSCSDDSSPPRSTGPRGGCFFVLLMSSKKNSASCLSHA